MMKKCICFKSFFFFFALLCLNWMNNREYFEIDLKMCVRVVSADPCEPCQNIPGPNVGSAPSGSSSGKNLYQIFFIHSMTLLVTCMCVQRTNMCIEKRNIYIIA